MRFGLSVMNLGELADARAFAGLARTAEAAGWDAVLTWDHLGFTWGVPAGDPWTLVTAAALATERVAVGTDIAVIARERPLPFASRVATIDRLSGGRVVLGVGLGGAEEEYRAAGEPVDRRERAALADELLDVVGRLLDGEEVTHEGPAVTVRGVTLTPAPGRHVPVWVGGSSAGARRRAARHDGWIPYPFDERGRAVMTAEDLRAGIEEIAGRRTQAGVAAAPFAVGVHGETPADPDDAAALVRPWAEAGATWWLESLHGYRGGLADLLARVEAGPPRG
jgi:alkanesulfonate monooxygenase SsuD/methylene tetrahydromethanopterin reductase-like flavin-dependent oxidoreductase (luciferase family)